MAANKHSLVVSLSFLVTALPAIAQVEGTLLVDLDRLQGTGANGQLLLYSPDPVQLGSSISHWDPTATPNLLMEPNISPDLTFLGLDITPALMRDIGWPVGTSNFEIFSLDEAGVGFDDPRPFAGAPGNPATTLGEARMNVFEAVLGAWADILESSVNVDVLVTWTSLPCEGGSAVLASASTTFVFREDAADALPLANTWYPSALAEAFFGEDASGPPDEDGGDIIVFMNADIDEECLAPDTGFYYGLDGNNPPNEVDQASTVLHELAHGLGFQNFTNEATGAEIQDLPGIYDTFTFDLTSRRTWAEMTDAERVTSAVNVRKVVWTGEQANDAGQSLLEPGVPELVVASPPEVSGTYEIGTAAFGPPIPAGGLSGEIACLVDGVPDGTILDGCTPAMNPGELAGKIALIDRGACLFVDKVANAEAAGAIGAIIVNNAGNDPINLGGDAPSIGIPAVGLGQRDGRALRRVACPAEAALLECTESNTTMCLDGDRFKLEVDWRDFNGSTGSARVVGVGSDDSGLFYFFDPSNWEMLVKVLDGCGINDRFWVFAAATTNVEYTLQVTDTQTGATSTYFNPLGVSPPAITDTAAFATCP